MIKKCKKEGKYKFVENKIKGKKVRVELSETRNLQKRKIKGKKEKIELRKDMQ